MAVRSPFLGQHPGIGGIFSLFSLSAMSYVESRLICGFGAGRSGTVHFRHALDGPCALLPAPTPFPQGAAVSSVGSWGCRCVHAMDSGGFLFGGDQKLLKEE